MKYALWTLQALLAALFLFGGVVKLSMPIEDLTAAMPLPALFIQFISVCEILGAIGLIGLAAAAFLPGGKAATATPAAPQTST